MLTPRVGEADEDGGGGHIRSVLLSNRATTLLKVRAPSHILKPYSNLPHR